MQADGERAARAWTIAAIVAWASVAGVGGAWALSPRRAPTPTRPAVSLEPVVVPPPRAPVRDDDDEDEEEEDDDDDEREKGKKDKKAKERKR